MICVFLSISMQWSDPGDSEGGVYVLETDRQPSMPPQPVEQVFMIDISGVQENSLAHFCLSGWTHLGYLVSVSSLNLFPLWGLLLLRPLLNCQNRTITTCEDVQPRWIRQKALDNSQHLIRWDHPVQIGAQAVHIHTSACAHLGQRVMLGEKGKPLPLDGSSVFPGCRGSKTCAAQHFLPLIYPQNSSVKGSTLNVTFWGHC